MLHTPAAPIPHQVGRPQVSSAFNALDRDGDGVITRAEFEQAMRGTGLSQSHVNVAAHAVRMTTPSMVAVPQVQYATAPQQQVVYAAAPAQQQYAVQYAAAAPVQYTSAPAVQYASAPAVQYAAAPAVQYAAAPAVTYSPPPAFVQQPVQVEYSEVYAPRAVPLHSGQHLREARVLSEPVSYARSPRPLRDYSEGRNLLLDGQVVGERQIHREELLQEGRLLEAEPEGYGGQPLRYQGSVSGYSGTSGLASTYGRANYLRAGEPRGFPGPRPVLERDSDPFLAQGATGYSGGLVGTF